MFLDLSKVFDKVWHDGILYKLRRMRICGEYLNFNEDLSKILQWRYKWKILFRKILFNTDPSKQAQEIVLSYKKNPSNHSDIYFYNMPLKRKNTQKHLGLYLDAKLHFSEHIKK